VKLWTLRSCLYPFIPYSVYSSCWKCNDPKLPVRVMRFLTVWWLLLLKRVNCISYPRTVCILPFVGVQPSVSGCFRILIFSVCNVKKAIVCNCGTDDLTSNQRLMLDTKSVFMHICFRFLLSVSNLICYLLRNKETLIKFVRKCWSEDITWKTCECLDG
jgi:hypothetical protein